MSLRVRLVLTTLVLLTIGLGVAGGTTYGFLRTFLLKRVDQQLLDVRDTAIRAVVDAARQQEIFGSFHGPGDGRGGRPIVPPGTYAEVLDSSGNRLAGGGFAYRDAVVDPPVLSARALGASLAADSVRVFTAPVQGQRGQHYRVIAYPIGGGDLAVVAIPLHDVDGTLSRLVYVEALVAAGVLVAIAVSSLLLIRRGLRPLDRMGDTAGAIAAGDLSRRVETGGGNTEIGRLGTALNGMLTQIEASFAEREETEKRLRRFLADASHELRTPLTSIRGWAELFRRGADARPEDLARTMRRIEDSASHMTLLVEDMLMLARLDEGRPFVREPVDLTDLAIDAVDDARAVEPDRPIDLVTPGPTTVSGDATRLREVFANLLSNARDHTPAGTPVHVRVSSSGATAAIEVADEGPGLTADQSARVFERFYRADPARTSVTGGAGLGLAIVAAIAAAHDGSADVRTAPGGGALFRVILPMA